MYNLNSYLRLQLDYPLGFFVNANVEDICWKREKRINSKHRFAT